ncbi:MAG TPA: hypothetical protein ENH34_00825 [Phycisphaerales bacterium]|nr:hypothetical protein [Phycisphaerales bacterium]
MNNLKYKPDFERAQTCWDAFWNREIIDRPCTVICAQNSDNPVEPPGIQPVGIVDFEPVFSQMDGYLQTHCFLGEAVPAFMPDFGPDQMAGFLGAPIRISSDNPETNPAHPTGVTSWAEKIVDDWKSFLPLRIEPDNTCWKRMNEFHAAAQDRFQGKCLLKNIDLHSNIDVLAALRGPENLVFDFIDEPEIILEVMNQVCKIYKQVYMQFHQYGNKEKSGTTTWLQSYSRGKHNVIQADFICLLSPDLFRRFVLPAIEGEAAFLDNCCFHLDGPDALKHLDDILAIKQIDAVQWVPGAGNKPQLQWPQLLHKIQSAGKSIILYGDSEQIKTIHGQYKPELVVYNVATKTEQEGLELLDWLKKHT